MNVYAINRTIDAIRNDKTHKFNMGDCETCIMGFAVRASENPDDCSSFAESVLGIDGLVGYRLFYPHYGVAYKATREDAATVLEHLRDTGKVNWKITKKYTGRLHEWYDRLFA
jgi:hypothetical protein